MPKILWGLLRFAASMSLQISGMSGILTNKHTMRAMAMNSKTKAKMG